MSIPNKVMLITYADSLGENLQQLNYVAEYYLKEIIGGIHLLPFFPSTGDRGFAPTDYSVVDASFGDWDDVEKLSKAHYLMFDFMINHISKESTYFQEYKKYNHQSKYKNMFIDVDTFYPPERPTNKDIEMIYKRKDKPPFQTVRFDDGEEKRLWNTFGEQQLDLDVKTDVTKRFIKQTIKSMADHGCSLIRLDAFAYAIKKLDSSCFFVEPDIWVLLDEIKEEADKYGIEILPEIHEHYSIQMKIAKHDYYIYDFALPMITLFSLYSGTSQRLKTWLDKSPMKQFTTLDTHDGIGVVDARDLLTDSEIDYTTENLYSVGANVKRIYSSEAYNNLDIYQINSSFYSALGDDDRSYLLARAIQCFAPGIPQIYYVGLLAGKNDIELLETTKEGRNINRHYYSLEEIDSEVQRPVVRKLFELLKYRNISPCFELEGNIHVETPDDSTLIIERISEDGINKAILNANLKSKEFTISDNAGFILKQLKNK